MREPRVRPASVVAGVGLLTLCVCLVGPAGAQSDDDGAREGSFSGQTLIGYRSVDVSGSEAKYREDINLEDGHSRLRLSNAVTVGTYQRAGRVNSIYGPAFSTGARSLTLVPPPRIDSTFTLPPR